MRNCDNCATPDTTGCSAYTPEDCGPNFSQWTPKDECICGNTEYGFDCVCDHVKNNPGDIDYSCEFCGLYTASKPRCNKCEAD